MYKDDTILVVGQAKPSKEDAIYSLHGEFYVSFVVERATGKILDLECNTILSVTRNFSCVDAAWKEFENGFGRDAAEYPGKGILALTQKPLIAVSEGRT